MSWREERGVNRPRRRLRKGGGDRNEITNKQESKKRSAERMEDSKGREEGRRIECGA